MLGRRWVIVAGLALTVVGGGVLAVQLPVALQRATRASEVALTKTRLAHLGQEEAALRTRISSIQSELGLLADLDGSLETRVEGLRKQIRDRRAQARELRVEVRALGG